MVWQGASHLRTMHGEEISVESAGLLRARRALRIPRIMRLAAPGTAGDLPQRLEVRATRGSDVVEVSFELIDLAQIAVPNDGEARGATLISEVRAHACAAGRVRGEALRFSGPALVELNRASA